MKATVKFEGVTQEDLNEAVTEFTKLNKKFESGNLGGPEENGFIEVNENTFKKQTEKYIITIINEE